MTEMEVDGMALLDCGMTGLSAAGEGRRVRSSLSSRAVREVDESESGSFLGEAAALSVRSLAGLEVACEGGGDGGAVTLLVLVVLLLLLFLLEEPGDDAPPRDGFASIIRRCISRDIFLLGAVLLPVGVGVNGGTACAVAVADDDDDDDDGVAADETGTGTGTGTGNPW